MAKISSADLYDSMMRNIEFTKNMLELKNNIPAKGKKVRIMIHRCDRGVHGNEPIKKEIEVIAYYDKFFLANVFLGDAVVKECFDYIDFIDGYGYKRPKITCGRSFLTR